MVPNRFYVSIDLSHDFWLHDADLIARIHGAGLQAGNEIVLFDGVEHERLYKLLELKDLEAHLELITEYARQLPKRNIYLLWAPAKPEDTRDILQKCTQTGVSHFVPLITDKNSNLAFSQAEVVAITIKAAEQGQWSLVPLIREPLRMTTAIEELSAKIQIFIVEAGLTEKLNISNNHVGLIIVPENGWSKEENQLLYKLNLGTIKIEDVSQPAQTINSAIQMLIN